MSNWGSMFVSVCVCMLRAWGGYDGVSDDSQLSVSYRNFLFVRNDHIGTLSFEDESVGML